MTTSSKNQLKKHYQIPAVRYAVWEQAIHDGTIVKKSETPIMQMIAAQMSYERKLAGGR
jgi:hypothetical protein